ncbi:hypothetical protein VNO80_09280 [Phaseolus coccineus]|uniref:Uncharacterized protein n=1 Tax=Phaseolus coccineus TaxID=3886 RepID=A0AAN9N7P1_PHACN
MKVLCCVVLHERFNSKISRAKKVSPFSLSFPLSPSSMPSPLTLTTGSVSFLGFPHFSFFHSLLSPSLSLSAFSKLGCVIETEEEKEEEEVGGGV